MFIITTFTMHYSISDGVMHSESGDNDGDDDELVRERWDDSDKDSAAKFFGKFIPETRWGMAERAVVDFQRNKKVGK